MINSLPGDADPAIEADLLASETLSEKFLTSETTNTMAQNTPPEIDFVAEASTAISNLEIAVETYQANEGKPNTDLLNARVEVNRLSAELNAAQQRLALEEQKGSFLDRLNAAVHTAENRVQSLLNNYTNAVRDQVLFGWFGQSIPPHAISNERKNDLELHVRISRLKQFKIGDRSMYEVLTPEYLFARAEKAATTLDALRKYIAKDQADNVK